jgi:hypothetical protein
LLFSTLQATFQLNDPKGRVPGSGMNGCGYRELGGEQKLRLVLTVAVELYAGTDWQRTLGCRTASA